MAWLVLGATGLLGPAVCAAIRARGGTAIGAARANAESNFDIGEPDALRAALDAHDPDAVFNCAALTDLAACEADPHAAHRVNAQPLSVLADWSIRTGRPLVHVSTDCFFTGDGAREHDEAAPIVLLHEYARSKHAAETFALKAPQALVLRTNLLGARKGFARFVLDALNAEKPATYFGDFYTSPVHVAAFAEAALDLAARGARGLYNLGGRGVASKADLARGLARRLGRDFSNAAIGSVSTLKPKRAESLGLDVRKAEAALGRALPTLDESLDAVIAEAA
jgi:dTDP-4-dehydrorhamnose reductase